MPNIGAVFKSEITRLARRSVKEQIGPLHASTAKQRGQISALNKEVQSLSRQVAALQQQLGQTQPAEAAAEDGAHRFTAKGLRTLRERLGLSAGDLGRLLGVGQQSIYAWEAGKTKPRRSHLPAIAELRGLGKREVQRRLAALPAQ